MELPAATKPTNANFVRVIRKKCSMNQGCHKRFYSHMFFCIIYFSLLKLPPPPRAAILVNHILYNIHIYIYIHTLTSWVHRLHPPAFSKTIGLPSSCICVQLSASSATRSAKAGGHWASSGSRWNPWVETRQIQRWNSRKWTEKEKKSGKKGAKNQKYQKEMFINDLNLNQPSHFSENMLVFTGDKKSRFFFPDSVEEWFQLTRGLFAAFFSGGMRNYPLYVGILSSAIIK